MVGKLTKLIIKTSSPRRVKTYCVSYSLGTHVCGFIGKESKLTGIIALDPSPQVFEANSPDGRLSKTDADAVFVFHSSNIIGFTKPIGDVDFYINGGKTQPVHCAENFAETYLSSGFRMFSMVCDHMFAYTLFFDDQIQFLTLQKPCSTNVFCPVRNASSIDGIQFPEIDAEKQLVKKWVTKDIGEKISNKRRSNSGGKPEKPV